MQLVPPIIGQKNYTEPSNCPQEFQITYSPGGRGSGLGALLLMKIRDNPDRITTTFSVYSSRILCCCRII